MSISGKLALPTVREQKERRKRFRAALALAGMSAQEFADLKDVDVTASHLSLVLHGKRESPPLIAKVDAFVAKYLPEVPASAVA